MSSVEPSKLDFRRIMGRFTTGVTIVTTRLRGQLHGMTANSVTSVSLEPLMVLVCIAKTADTHDILAQAGVFAVNILSRNQEALSLQFARKDTDDAHRIADLPHRLALSGSPVLEGALAYLDCRIVAQYPGGDHTIFLGEVLDAGEVSDDGPLVFYDGRYLQLNGP